MGSKDSKLRRYDRYNGLARSAWATTMRGSREIRPRSFIIINPLAQRRNVSQVPSGNDEHIRRFPIKLLNNFDSDGFLAFHTQ